MRLYFHLILEDYSWPALNTLCIQTPLLVAGAFSTLHRIKSLIHASFHLNRTVCALAFCNPDLCTYCIRNAICLLENMYWPGPSSSPTAGLIGVFWKVHHWYCARNVFLLKWFVWCLMHAGESRSEDIPVTWYARPVPLWCRMKVFGANLKAETGLVLQRFEVQSQSGWSVN